MPTEPTTIDDLTTDFPRLTAYLLDHARQPGARGGQMYVSLHNEPIVDTSWAGGGIDVQPTDLVQWASSTKVVPTVAFGQAWDRGLVDVDDEVDRHLPGYGTNGKEGVTVRHLLTHTSGLQDLPPPTFVTHDRDEVLARCCAAGIKEGWERGRMASYGGSGPFLIGEIVAALDGRPFWRCVREAIFEPLGMADCWVGMPVDEFDRVTDRVRHRYRQPRDGEQVQADLVWTSRENIHRSSAGGGGLGPVRELARMYELLLGRGERDGVRLLSPQAVEAITARQRVGLGVDVFGGRKLDLGLFLYLDSKYVDPESPNALYGTRCSPRTFGHPGAGGMNAFADPEAGLAVAMYVPGPNAGAVGGGSVTQVATALYEDLGIDLS